MQVNQWLSWTAGVGAVQLRYGSPDLPGFPSTRLRFIYSGSPTFRLNRQWSVTIGFSRQYYAYTPKAISQTTYADEQSANIIWTPDTRSRIELELFHRGISPEFLTSLLTFRLHGNGGTLDATRTIWKREKAQFDAGYEAMLFGYTHSAGLPSPEFNMNIGVFSPRFYQRHGAVARASWAPCKFLTWDLHGTLGGQQIGQGSNATFSSTAGSRLDFLLSPRTTFSLGYDYFNTASALQAFIVSNPAASYHSNNVTASLDFHF
jgi:hypothetical protein